MQRKFATRAGLLVCTALASSTFMAAQAHAQAAEDTVGLEEIIVTAQKREQSVQDVPIAVTAVTQETLQANRITTVNDLSAIAPGLTVKPSAGGIQVPAFTMRGQVSFGVVAGSDKQVSIYLDGVYLSNPRGSIFDLPDIQRLEVLRGPQGTLFGRNATAGAISITTRDPGGEFKGRIEGTYGNLDQYRIRATIETPQIGPFSALFSYVRNYRRGEIENAAAGLVWDRTGSPDPLFARRTTSARWLGTTDSHSYFASVKFEPSPDFKMIYKFDRNDDSGTPEGTGALNFNTNLAGPGLVGNILSAFATTNNLYLAPSGKRPDIVTNGWVIPRQARVQGHSLTATWTASDNLTVKNIAGYRKAFIFAPSAIDGISSLAVTPEVQRAYGVLFAASILGAGFFALPQATQDATADQFAAGAGLVPGSRMNIIASQASSRSKQYSDELIVNYSSEKLQATLGALWFQSEDVSGGPEGMQNTTSFPAGFFSGANVIGANGVFPIRNEGRTFNQATSLAAYAQLEYKVTPEFELVAGARITKDKKDSQFRWDTNGVPQQLIRGTYSKTKPNFSVGVNYKPNPDTLLYAKWSNSFVSGGEVATLAYEPETATSYEIGAKMDFFDRKLRANLALFHVDYKHLQQSASPNFPPTDALALTLLTASLGDATLASNLRNSLSTFIVDSGDLRAKGFELELTAAPTRGLVIGSGVGYTDSSFPFVNPLLLAASGNRYDITARPKWTISAYATYETQPLIDDATLQFRMDGLFRSRIQFPLNPTTFLLADGSNAAGLATQGFWLVNGRVALKHLKIGGAEAELAVWGKNITDRKDATFSLNVGLVTSMNYLPPRTYGVDLSIAF
jgi:iron complex outermembrane recepter protein